MDEAAKVGMGQVEPDHGEDLDFHPKCSGESLGGRWEDNIIRFASDYVDKKDQVDSPIIRLLLHREGTSLIKNIFYY